MDVAVATNASESPPPPEVLSKGETMVMPRPNLWVVWCIVLFNEIESLLANDRTVPKMVKIMGSSATNGGSCRFIMLEIRCDCLVPMLVLA